MFLAAKCRRPSLRLYRKTQKGQYSKSVIRVSSAERARRQISPSFTRRRKSSASIWAFLAALGSLRFSKVISCKSNLGSVFRLETPGDQLSRPRRETLGVGQHRRFAVYRAIVFLKLARSQPVVGALGVLIGQHRRHGKSPAALGTRPASQALMRYPCKPSAHSSPSLPQGGKEYLGPITFFTSWQESGEC